MTQKGKSLIDDLTQDQIQEIGRLARIGCNNELIAECMDIPYRTLMDCKDLRRIATQKRALHKADILKDQTDSRPKNPVMQIWQGKNFLGQSDKQEVRHGVSQAAVELLGLVDGQNRGKLPTETDDDIPTE